MVTTTLEESPIGTRLFADVVEVFFDITEIYESAPNTLEEDPIVVYDWVDISSKIRVGDN